MPKPTIRRYAVLGDSLSDRDTLEKLWKFGLPMGLLSGLVGKSPEGRFTNGLAWDDAFAAKMASELLIHQEFKTKDCGSFGSCSMDMADEVISAHRDKTTTLLENAYFLDNDLHVGFEGREDFLRTFAEGGLTAHSYKGKLSTSLTRFTTRFLVSTLEAKRNKLFADDATHRYSAKHKAETLVMEESGVNDLITVNKAPSFEEVENAISARIHNVEEMIKHGYRHFMLFDIPNIANTPEFQEKTESERVNARSCVKYFNQRLELEIKALEEKYPDEAYSFSLYQVSKVFDDVYQHPNKHGFSLALINEPYVESQDFSSDKSHLKDSHKHIFWDKLHPTAHLHEIVATDLKKEVSDLFNIKDLTADMVHEKECNISEEELIDAFLLAYQRQLKIDQKHSGFFYHPKSNLTEEDLTSLKSILNHALNEGGNRSKKVLETLDWINKDGQLKHPEILNLKQAFDALKSPSVELS